MIVCFGLVGPAQCLYLYKPNSSGRFREADAEDSMEEPLQRRGGGHAGRTLPSGCSWSQ